MDVEDLSRNSQIETTGSIKQTACPTFTNTFEYL